MALGDGIPVTIQAKDRKGFEMAATQRGLKEQMENAGVKWGFAIHKKRGTTNVGEYYAVLPVALMMEILDAALEYEGSRHPERRKRVIPRYPPS